MPKSDVVMTEVIQEPFGLPAYGQVAGPSLVEGGATVLVADRQPDVIEGEWPATQTVVLEFQSAEAAPTWYYSDPYQSAKIGHAAAVSNVIAFSGLDSGNG
jgi:uncharacterized protein (DUF1330 family)